MIPPSPLLLLAVFHAVITMNLDFESCNANSVCIVHMECVDFYNVDRDDYKGAHLYVKAYDRTRSWHPIPLPLDGSVFKYGCTQVVKITPISSSEWEVEMHNAVMLDGLVSCTAGTPAALDSQVLARSPKHPQSRSTRATPAPTFCRIHVTHKNGGSLTKLLGSSTIIRVDGAVSGVLYDKVEGMAPCLFVDSLFDSCDEQDGSCEMPGVEQKMGGMEQWTCETPFVMMKLANKQWAAMDSVQCDKGVVKTMPEGTVLTRTDTTRITCRSHKTLKFCDVAQLTCNGCNLQTVATSPVRVKCASGELISGDDWTTPQLTCSTQSDFDHPIWETEGGKLVAVENVKCLSKLHCSMNQFVFECGSYNITCPGKECDVANVTTIWPNHANDKNQTMVGLEVDGLTCDEASGTWRARRFNGDVTNRTFVVKSGAKLSCTSRSFSNSVRSLIQLPDDLAATGTLTSLFMLTIVLTPLLINAGAHCVIARFHNRRDRRHHAQLTAGVSSNRSDRNSDTVVLDTIQSKYGMTEAPKMSLGQQLAQFFSSPFGKREKEPSDRSNSARRKLEEDEEKEKLQLLTGRPDSSVMSEVSAPPKDSVVEQPVVDSAPSQALETARQDDGQPPSSVSKQITSPGTSEENRANKEGPPSHSANITSSNSGGLKQQPSTN